MTSNVLTTSCSGLYAIGYMPYALRFLDAGRAAVFSRNGETFQAFGERHDATEGGEG